MRISKTVVPVALALAIAGLVSVEAPAAAPAVTATVDFPAVDANKDGKLTAAEVENIDDLRASFGTLDVNHDQALTPTEFAHWSGAAKTLPVDPTTAPGGSAGAQHMPNSK